MYRSQPLISPVEALDEAAPVVAHVDTNAGLWPAAPAPDLPARLTEVDARSIPGHGAKVALYLSISSAVQHYVVQIETADGGILATITADTRAAALDAYRHPFARPDVPDIFTEAA
jgi:hypothetical protein